MVEISDSLKGVDVALVCNPGGHLQSMKFLQGAYEDHEYAFLTHRSVTTEDLVRTVWFTKLGYDHKFGPIALLQYLVIFFETIYLLVLFSPTVFISTGGYLAPPVLIAAKLFGKHVIFVENISRKTSKSVSGRILYPLADRFFVQHEDARELYGEKAEYVGAIV